jgi:hypothetical protein
MKTIRVEIRIHDEEYAPAFGKLDALHVWEALCRAFPFARGDSFEVKDLPAEQVDG